MPKPAATMVAGESDFERTAKYANTLPITRDEIAH